MPQSIELKAIIDAEDRMSSVVTGIEKKIGNFKTKMESLEPAFRKMSTYGAVSFAALTAGAVVMIKNASDLTESVNAVNVVFGAGSKKVLEFSKTASKTVGMTAAAFNQMSTQTGALLKDTGISADSAAEKTIILTKRAADMASVFNTDVSDAMSAINQALRGETEAIRRYAGDVTDATLQTYANSVGIQKNVADMDQQEKRLLRIDLILKQTSVTQGDFANTSDSLANRQRILTATITDLTAKIGMAFVPVVEKMLSVIAPVIIKVTEWVDKHPKLSMAIIASTIALTALVAVVGTIGLVLPAIITGFTALGTVVTAVGTAMAFLAANPMALVLIALAATGVAVWKLVEAYKALKKQADEANASAARARETQAKVDVAISKAKTPEAKARLERAQAGQAEAIRLDESVGSANIFKQLLIGAGFASYDKGGVIPGVNGEPQLAVVHGGERVLTTKEIEMANKKGFDIKNNFNNVINKVQSSDINKTINKVQSSDINKTGFINKILNVIGLPSYDKGGVVSGAVGSPQIAVVHGGERVLTADEANGNRQQTLIFNFNGAVAGDDGISQIISRTIKQLNRDTTLKTVGGR